MFRVNADRPIVANANSAAKIEMRFDLDFMVVFLVLSSGYWLIGLTVSPSPEGIIEDMIGYLPALFDSFGFIEAPVDAEVDAALAVLFFGL